MNVRCVSSWDGAQTQILSRDQFNIFLVAQGFHSYGRARCVFNNAPIWNSLTALDGDGTATCLLKDMFLQVYTLNPSRPSFFLFGSLI